MNPSTQPPQSLEPAPALETPSRDSFLAVLREMVQVARQKRLEAERRQATQTEKAA